MWPRVSGEVRVGGGGVNGGANKLVTFPFKPLSHRNSWLNHRLPIHAWEKYGRSREALELHNTTVAAEKNKLSFFLYFFGRFSL